MAKTADQLDREIAEFLAKPKLGDPEWERSWADLLAEKHTRARTPTIDEFACAFSYIESEFVISGGRIDMEQLAEGLAFGQRHAVDAETKLHAKEVLKQLPRAALLHAAERANYLAREQGQAARYIK